MDPTPEFGPNPMLRNIVLAVLALSLANYSVRLIPFSVFDYGAELTESMTRIDTGSTGSGAQEYYIAMNAVYEFWMVLFVQSVLSICFLTFSVLRELFRVKWLGHPSRIRVRSFSLYFMFSIMISTTMFSPGAFAEFMTLERMAILPYPLRLAVMSIGGFILIVFSVICVFEPARAQQVLDNIKFPKFARR